MDAPAPRLYVIPATRAPVALVFCHGAAGWWRLVQWDVAAGALTPGAWFRGHLFPRRCNLSSDGRVLCYLASKNVRGWMGATGYQAFSALSKAPWLFALAAWREHGTYTRGYHFVEGATAEERPWEIPPPETGDAEPVRRRWGLAQTRPAQYAVERRRGWTEHEDCPPRGRNDAWDEQRRCVLVKERPRDPGRLVATDRGHDFHGEGRTEGRRPAYRVEVGRKSLELEDAVWADWDAVGRLLVATIGGLVQVRDGDGVDLRVVWQRDLAMGQVTRGPAPPEAQRW